MKKIIAFAVAVLISSVLMINIEQPVIAQYSDCACFDRCWTSLENCVDFCAAFGPPAPYCLQNCSNQYVNCTGHCGSQEAC